DIGGGKVEVRFTISGDANLDGTVDTIDFNLLAASFSQTAKTWFNGDFDYSGTVDTIDFNLLASNFSQMLPAGATASSALIPEVSFPALSMLLCGLWKRRRSRLQHV